MSRLLNLRHRLMRSELLVNSAWGVIGNLMQTGLTSGFFVILARKFPADNFAQFLIANTVYQLVAAFSSMGLSQWFIREYASSENKSNLSVQYLKIQILLGAVFYVVNVVGAFFLYTDDTIRLLSLILGTNVIFDNVINAIKSLNIAEFVQRKSASISLIDASLKLAVGGLLFLYPLSVVYVAMLLVATRLITVNLFVRIGSATGITLNEVWVQKISLRYLRTLLVDNWYFVVIGSVSVVYWSVANIIISKTLTLKDVANYEISFKIFSIMILLPIVASGSIFPRFIQLYKNGQIEVLKNLFNTIQRLYILASIIVYCFVMSFSQFWLPFVFGSTYEAAIPCVNLMFLAFLFFPTVLLQANLIVAMNMERMDMVFNLCSLACNVGGCLIGLSLYRSLSVVNYSIAASFLVFHLLQDALLIRKGMVTWTGAIVFYGGLAAFVPAYQYAVTYTGAVVPFAGVCLGAALIMIGVLAKGDVLFPPKPTLAEA